MDTKVLAEISYQLFKEASLLRAGGNFGEGPFAPLLDPFAERIETLADQLTDEIAKAESEEFDQELYNHYWEIL